MKKIIFSIVLGLSMVTSAFALEGNAESGKAKSAMCAACHNADGNSLVPMYPKLAGQSAEYIVKQLADFKAGAMSGGKEGRNNAIMGGMVMGLSEQDMADLAAYFSGKKRTADTGTASEHGKKLFIAGDATRKIPACSACHSIDGKGMPKAGFPSVDAQHVDYLKTQLMAFRAGTRNNDMNGMMRNIANKLTDADIDAIAQYMSSLK